MSKPKIVVLTDFFGKYDGYSVSNVAFTEAEAFVKLGYDVTMVVRHSYPKSEEVEGIKFSRIMPDPTKQNLDPNFAELGVEWTDWKKAAEAARDILQKNLGDFDIAITHDWLLQNSCIPWNYAIRRLKLPRLTWFHRLHSYPTGDRTPENEFNDVNTLKCTLPNNGEHFLVWANNGHALWLAERYHSNISKVKVIPLGINWPKYYGMDPQSEFIIDVMNAFNADLVQCYAFCSSRVMQKGVRYLILIFAAFKRLGYRVKLILCNANSTDEKGKERDTIVELSNLAREYGLVENEDFCFTSRIHTKFRTGVKRATVKDLQSISNIFIFPSETETYGLVALEAASSGAALVLNEGLVPLKEVGGTQAMYLQWDSDHRNERTMINWNPNVWEGMFQYARAIIPEISTNRVLQNKIRVLREHYMVNVARRYWEPLFYQFWNTPIYQRGEDQEAQKFIRKEEEQEIYIHSEDEVMPLGDFMPQIGVEEKKAEDFGYANPEKLEELQKKGPVIIEFDAVAGEVEKKEEEDANVQCSDSDSEQAGAGKGSEVCDFPDP